MNPYHSLAKPATLRSGPTAGGVHVVVRVFAFGYPAAFAFPQKPTEPAMRK